jgi:hypothetical protein
MGMVNWYSPAAAIAGVTSAGFTAGTIRAPWCGYIRRVRVIRTAGAATRVAFRASTTVAPVNFETRVEYALTQLPLDADEATSGLFYALTLGATQDYYRTLHIGLQTNAAGASTFMVEVEVESPTPTDVYGLSAPGA